MIRFYLRTGAAATTLLCAAAATAQNTEFTYQGQLKQAGVTFSGLATFDCVLWDADSLGNPVGPPLSLPGVNVNDGLFTVQLDFGAGVFDGSRRWLEINVNGVTLSPRQEITPAPYAMFAARPWVTSGADISYVAGNVGIGTASPSQMLSVAGTIESTGNGFMFPDGTVQATAATGGGGFWSPNAADIFGNNTGSVGIGTSTPASKLHVVGGPGWTSNGWTKSLALNNAAALEFGYGASTTRYGIGESNNQLYYFTTSTEGTAAPANYYMTADSAGRVGIGTLTPSSKLDITAIGPGAELLRFTTERPWIFRQIYSGPSTGLQLYSTAGAKNFEITCSSGVNCATFFTQDADPRVGIATNSPQATLDVNGTTRTRVLQITGADVAEKFPSGDEKVEPGTVMEIDPENAGQLRKARGAYNQRVAGVVSGANDFPAGAILGHMSGLEDAPAIALSGRVWVQCDASTNPIGLGDLLTTSDIPGHAMRAVDRERSHGAVIGKAMTCLAAGERGLVLVLVNLQ